MSFFQEKIILITGASSGIGKALSLKLAEDGAKVTNADIQKPDFEHPNISYQPLDVSNYDDFEGIFNGILKQYDRIDYVFNNAGIGIASETQDLSIEQWKKVININLMGVVYGTKIAYNCMVKQGFGHIINTASLAGLIPFPTSVPYATTKHAVVGLTKSLRAEGVAYNVKLSAICPGFIATPIYENSIKVNVTLSNVMKTIPFQPMTLEKAVENILKGVQQNKSLITFPFHARFAYLIARWFPRLADKFLFEKAANDFRKLKQKI